MVHARPQLLSGLVLAAFGWLSAQILVAKVKLHTCAILAISILQIHNASDLVKKNAIHLVWMDAQVAHGDRGIAVVESLREDLEANPEPCPLNIPESLPQRVGAIIALEIDRPRPGFDHLVDPLDGDGGVSSAACEKEIIVVWINGFQVTFQCLPHAFIDHQDVLFSRLAFLDGDALPRFKVPQLPDAELQEVPNTQAIVDPHRKQQKIAR
jgi:hypothetical protein